tara:strand:- start:314 stop:928 length:615 start_codon:yes stop_codon:yes gene_type:complete
MKNKILLIGSEEDMILELNSAGFSIIGFIGNKKKSSLRYLGDYSKISSHLNKFKSHKVCIAMGPLNIRKKFYKLYSNRLLTYISKKSVIGKKVSIEKGSFIQSGCFIGNNVKIGKACKINVNVSVHHDSKIGSFTDVAPSSTILGNVTMGNSCYIGSGSVIREKLKITNNVMTGINSAVVKNITSKGLYYGVPAKKKKNTYSRP